MTKRKSYTAKQKAQIVLELLKEEKTVAQISSEYGIHANQLHHWKKQALEGLPTLFERSHKAEREAQAAMEKKTQALYAEIGRLTTQVNWLKKKSGLEPLDE